MEQFVGEFDCFTFVKDKQVYCKICAQTLVYRNKQSLQQHLQTKKHIQTLSGPSHKEFYDDLCQAFIDANIPFKKLNNPSLRQFLHKYTNRDIPDESTIRKFYVPRVYDKTISAIKAKISENYLWVSTDETTDLKGRCVVNVIVGILSTSQPSEQYLVSTTFHETVNAEKICKLVENGLEKMYTGDVSKVLLFVSDAASVMLKTGKLLKQKFPNMLHLTCCAHALHRVAEFIRESFPDVNSLISLVKFFY